MKVRQIIGIGLVGIVLGGTYFLGGRLAERTGDSSGKVSVVTSFYPLYEFARQVGGDKVSVTNVTPAGSEPHDYEPTPQQLVQAREAKVFAYNGGSMEPWTENFVKDYTGTLVNGSAGIELRSGVNEDGVAEPGLKDPHYWLDPVLAQKTVNDIRDALVKADPANASYYRNRAEQYGDKLTALDREFTDGLRECRVRTVVTSHAAFGYMAARYNFEAVAISGLNPEEEPSPAKLAELSELVKSRQIGYVFFESLVSPKLAETVANEAGAKTIVFDPIEGVSDDDQKTGKDYLAIQRENLASLRTAMACQ